MSAGLQTPDRLPANAGRAGDVNLPQACYQSRAAKGPRWCPHRPIRCGVMHTPMVPADDGRVTHGDSAKPPEIRVPGSARVAAYLVTITPLLAPVLRTHEVALPITTPLVPPVPQTDEAMLRYWEDLQAGYHEALVRSKLTGTIVNNRAARDDLLAQLLAPPTHTITGVPLHVPDASVTWPSRFSQLTQRNLSKPMRMLTAAIRHDLAGGDLRSASRFLGRADYGWESKKNGEWHEDGGSCAGTVADLAAARRCLHMLGAWPYAHGEKGRLGPEWWLRVAFNRPLEDWYHRGDAHAATYLKASRRFAAATYWRAAPPSGSARV